MRLNHRRVYLVLGSIILVAGAGFIVSRSFSSEETTVSALARQTHFHGIAVDHGGAARLYLATHHGFYAVTPDGKASRVSQTRDDFMGFTPHPTDAAILYASGHPSGGGNLGFMASSDGGRSWSKLSNGINGPVDFHQMDVSRADPKVIYGVYGGLQRSTDGGRTWGLVGPAPEGLIGIAASAGSAGTIYAATQRGLLASRDGGHRWTPAHGSRQAATMVHTAADGAIYAFIAGTGLLRATEPGLDWLTLSNGFGRDVVLHLAGAPPNGGTLYAVTFDSETRAQAVRVSHDGGRNWALMGG